MIVLFSVFEFGGWLEERPGADILDLRIMLVLHSVFVVAQTFCQVILEFESACCCGYFILDVTVILKKLAAAFNILTI